MNKKKKIISRAVFVIFGVIYLIISQIYGTKRFKNQLRTFDESEIIGRIEKVRISHHGTGFNLSTDSTEYIFYPYTSELNKKNVFHQYAKKGDSIIKLRLSDTLILIKKNVDYKYTFQKTEYK